MAVSNTEMLAPRTRRPLQSITMRWLAIALISISVAPLGGCRICAECDDLDYPSYGGAWQRTRRDGGRVGSMFDPAGARAATLVSRDTPLDSDVIERQRQEQRDDGGTDLQDPDEMDEDRELEEPDSDDSREGAQEREDELRQKKLEDIEFDGEDEMRNKSLDEINIRIIPGQPLPPIMQ